MTLGSLLDSVRGVHWPSRKPVAGGLSGTQQSKMRCPSDEFTEYRLYRQGDDPRRLDWRLLARSDRAYIRLATDRAVLPTTIVLDSTSSMAFPLHSHEKWNQARRLAIALAAVVHADGDPVGLAVRDDRGESIVERRLLGVVGGVFVVAGTWIAFAVGRAGGARVVPGR